MVIQRRSAVCGHRETGAATDRDGYVSCLRGDAGCIAGCRQQNHIPQTGIGRAGVRAKDFKAILNMRRSGRVQGEQKRLAGNQIAGHGIEHGRVVTIECFDEGYRSIGNAGQRLRVSRQ